MSSFESLTKDVKKLAANDKLYDIKYANQETEYMMDKRPHRSDPKFFKKAKISLMAVIKMLTHARMGGNIEVMGHFMGNIMGELRLLHSSR
jgi:COP9 signalosome complex subunit 5